MIEEAGRRAGLNQTGASESGPIHATLVARFSRGAWRGLLLRGASGSGKSTLALALIGRGWRLVADDWVIAWTSGARLWGRAPAVLSGLLEVRGVGVLAIPALHLVEVKAVIDAVEAGAAPERVLEPTSAPGLAVALPLGRLDLAAPSAPDRAAAFCDAVRV